MKVVLQDGIKDCGICSLLSIIRHYGGNVSKEYLRQLTSTTKNGVTAYKLVESAEKLGFHATALTGDIKNIDVNNLPCIAHVIINKSYQHFIVIYEVDFKRNLMVVMDPAKGKRIFSISEFKLMSSNCFIFLTPDRKLPNFQNHKVMKEMIISSSQKQKVYFIFLLFLTILYFIFNILSAFHFKYLIDFSINYDNSYNIIIISVMLFVIYLSKEVSSFLKDIILLKYSEVLDLHITMKIYKQIILLPYLYYKNRTTGEIISRIKDLSSIKDFLAQLFTSITTDFFCIVLFLFLLMKINSELTLITFVFFIGFILIQFLFKGKIKKRVKHYYRKEEGLNSYLIESLSSVDAVKGMHVEKIMIDRFYLKYKNLLEAVYQVSIVEKIFVFIKNNFYHLFHIIILSYGSFFVINKKIPLSGLIVFHSLLTFLMSSFQNIVNLLHEYPTVLLSLERIEDLFTIRKEIFKGRDLYKDYKVEGDIVYHNLTFSYGSREIFKNVNLKIRQGDKVFLYGESGSGKSTLMKLLMRYIEVEFGNIRINDIDINHYHLDLLRENITYISQQEFLYTDTIYNNITLKKEIDKETVLKAIQLTLVDEIIDHDALSLDKLVEENGFNFSGGERQRLILARSILKSSNIYIFDEALSQIDIERERIILENIFREMSDKTIIVISHRFHNMDLFDRILKLEDGIIHEEELRKKPIHT